MADNKKRNALGRGLSALLENAETDVTTTSGNTPKPGGSVNLIPVSQIEANPFQPRTEFEKEALEELAASIRVHGIIQPVTVRKIGYDQYQLISGERRTRASILAGLTAIPAYVRVADDQSMLEMALIENIQRRDLNAIEIAISYKRLLEECDLKQEELGDRVGKDRSTISNYLRLLKLPDEVQAGIRDGQISMGHARAIIGIDDPEAMMALFHEIVNEQLSVRAVEEIVRNAGKNIQPQEKEGKAAKLNLSEFKNFRDVLARKLDTKVAFKARNNGGGDLVISFEDKNELIRILNLL